MSLRGWFITATDTGVGKTTVGCALAAALTRRGHIVAPMKPCETGGGDDAERLIRATGRAWPLERVRPYHFALAASPEVAAAAEGSEVSIGNIHTMLATLLRSAAVALVEGAGGLLVPLGAGQTMADLAGALDLPLLVVARPSLGTVNHTLLTLEAARRRGLRVDGVILSRTRPETGPDEPTNPAAIARHGNVRVLGTLPWLSTTERDDPAALADAAEHHLDLASLGV